MFYTTSSHDMPINEFSDVLSCWSRLKGFPRLTRLRTSLLASIYMDKDISKLLLILLKRLPTATITNITSRRVDNSILNDSKIRNAPIIVRKNFSKK